MGTTTYIATGLPVTVSPMTTVAKALSVGDSGAIQGLSITIDVDAPNEGGGKDTSLIKAYIIHTYVNGTSTDAVLHDGEYKNLNYAQYPQNTNPNESLDIFTNRSSLTAWTLYIFNISASANATLNYFSVAITYSDTIPAGNTGVNIEPSSRYGTDVNLHQTLRLLFDMESDSNNSNANNYRHIPYNCTLNTLVVNTQAGTATGSPNLGVYRISNGVKTLIALVPIITTAASTRSFVTFIDGLNFYTNDFISVEMVGSNIAIPPTSVQMELYK